MEKVQIWKLNKIRQNRRINKKCLESEKWCCDQNWRINGDWDKSEEEIERVQNKRIIESENIESDQNLRINGELSESEDKGECTETEDKWRTD